MSNQIYADFLKLVFADLGEHNTARRMNLLIIDDDAICTFINNRVAEKSGLFRKIHSLGNGEDAIAHLRSVCDGSQPPPHMILVDLNMPIMNGFDFVRALRGLSFPGKENIGIVILTSSDDSSDIEQARKLGIDHYLIKPLTVNGLQATVFSLQQELWKKSLNSPSDPHCDHLHATGSTLLK